MNVKVIISVRLPKITADQRLRFIERTLETFRDVFPKAELRVMGEDYDSPVTVVFDAEDEKNGTD